MKIRESVFGSDNEKTLFKTLQSYWSDKFDLWPNLPFTNIIDIGDSSLSDKERDFIYKTSVDYTLCKKDGKPLLSIEFDGLGHGFSRGGKYIQLVPTPDKYRKLKLELKLRITDKVGYPLFVVSYNEKEPIGPGVHLTIVDGIIGQVLAKKAFLAYSKERLSEYKEVLSTLPEDECADYLQTLITNAEVNAQLKWNPIKSLAIEYEVQAIDKGLVKEIGYRIPEMGDYADFESYLNDLENIIEKERNAIRVGSECVVKTPFGEVHETVWVRNIEGHGADGKVLASEIAELLAFKKVLDLYGKRGSHD